MIAAVVAAGVVGAGEILKEGVVEAPEVVVRRTEIIVAVGVVLITAELVVRPGVAVASCVPIEVAGVVAEAGVVELAAVTMVL